MLKVNVLSFIDFVGSKCTSCLFELRFKFSVTRVVVSTSDIVFEVSGSAKIFLTRACL